MKTKSILSLASAVIAFSFLFSSCSKDGSNSPQPKEETESWTTIKEFDVNNTHPRRKARTESSNTPLTVALLKDMGFDLSNSASVSQLKDIFKSKDGQVPDGIRLNTNVDAGSVDGRNPLLNDANVSVVVGKCTGEGSTKVSDAKDQAFVFEHEIVNNSDTEQEVDFKYSYKQGHKTSWSTKLSTGVKAGLKFKLDVELANTELSAEVSLASEAANGGETSEEQTVEETQKVKVPAHSKITGKATTTLKQYQKDMAFPVSLTGTAILNYQHDATLDVPGASGSHYFWAFKVDGKDKDFNIENQKGTVTYLEYAHVKVEYSKAVKL